MKLVSVILVMFFTVSGTFADNQSEMSFEKSADVNHIIVDQQGWWLTGILTGTVDASEWVDGVIWSSGELDIRTNNISQPARYPSFNYQLSVIEQPNKHWNSLFDVQDSQSYIFEFRSKAFWSSPFSSESNLILIRTTKPVENFLDSQAYKQFPDGVEAQWDYRSTWFFREKVSRGIVTRVQRINRRLLSNQCIIDVHLGGYRNIANYRNEWIPQKAQMSDQIPGEGIQDYLTSRKTYRSVPNVGQFTTYSEDLCRYAEDAAVTAQEVNILYSDFWSSREGLIDTEIYRIWVEAPSP